jgi:hypothetical protein
LFIIFRSEVGENEIIWRQKLKGQLRNIIADNSRLWCLNACAEGLSHLHLGDISM